MAELAGDELRRAGSLRLAADDAERGELAAELEALRDDGFAAEWVDGSRRRSTGCSTARCSTRATGRSILRGGCAGWRRRAVDAGAEIVERSRVRARRARGRRGRRRDRRAHRGLAAGARKARSCRCAGRCSRRRRSPSGCSSGPHYARHGFDYWQQLADGRLVVGGKRDVSFETEDTDVEETTPLVQEPLEAFVGRAARRAAAGHAPLGRDLGRDAGPAAARRAGPGPSRRLGRRRLLGSRQRARLRLRRPGRAGDPRRAPAGARALRPRTLRLSRRRARSRVRQRPGRPRLATRSATAAAQSSNEGRSSSADALERGDRDREILDREPGRVEGRDLVAPRPARRPRRRAPRRAASRRSRSTSPASTACDELAAVARLLPVVAEDARRARARDARSRPCPGPSAPIRLTCWPGPERALAEQRPRGPASPSRAGRRRAPPRASRATAQPSSSAARPRARRVDVPERDVAAAREERPRRRAPVHAGADHRRGRGVGAPERLRREHRGRAGPQRGHGTPRRAPPRAARRRRSTAARARSPSAARAPGCRETTSPT